MNAVTADSFVGLVSLALERMAFVVMTPSEESCAEVLVRSVAHATIEVTGDQNYVLGVSVTPGLVKEVVAGMMGLDADEVDVDDHARATVMELANIFGGELIMLVTGGYSQLALGLPRDVSDEEAGAQIDAANPGGFAHALACDAGSLVVSVRRT